VSSPPPGGLYRRILCATDGSPASRPVADQAIALARALEAELLVLYAVRADYHAGIHLRDEVHEEVQAGMACNEEIVARARAQDVPARGLIVEGHAGPAIVEAAGAEQADLVMLGRQGVGFLERILLGSVASYVAEHSPVAVLIVPAP